MPGEAYHQGDRFCLFRPMMELAIGWMTEQLKLMRRGDRRE